NTKVINKKMKKLNWMIIVALIFSIHSYSWAQKEKEINVKISGGKLYGTLLTPKSPKNAPVVLLIPGSGATDRNGNSMMMQPNSYRLLAEVLAENGIASLRYDKAFIGKSENSLEEKDIDFSHNVEQVVALIDYLQKKKFNTIILIGHSEGSLIGMLAAQEREISKFVSLSGTGRTIDNVLTQQIEEQAPHLLGDTKQILSELKQGNQVDNVPAELAALFRESVQPYLISWIKLNPKLEIGRLTIPTLIVHGSTDFQVTNEDAELQKEGNESAELVIIEGMNHVLKEAVEDKEENMKTYFNPKLPLHEELIPKITEFILE
ncbi:MAG TPA: alpha/beta fold hydrolase, partial [Brumimicrobium sp.]|nr:alpha/beta fold hydrolase [Brumimicrobium sp.]